MQNVDIWYIRCLFLAELPVCDRETVIAFKDLHIKK